MTMSAIFIKFNGNNVVIFIETDFSMAIPRLAAW